MRNAPIIIKKISGHGGHNGGAWKVAYADFVTAMMALFIVLWLLNSSKQCRWPWGEISGIRRVIPNRWEARCAAPGRTWDLKKDMSKIKEALLNQIKSLPDFEKLKSHIDMTITDEGLRIELTEGEKGDVLRVGQRRAKPQRQGVSAFPADEVGKLPNHVSIEGHTDSKPYSGRTDRLQQLGAFCRSRQRGPQAIMQSSGLQQQQVSQVRGFADQRPRPNSSPDDPANRRISLIVEYLSKEVPAGEKSNAPQGGIVVKTAEP